MSLTPPVIALGTAAQADIGTVQNTVAAGDSVPRLSAVSLYKRGGIANKRVANLGDSTCDKTGNAVYLYDAYDTLSLPGGPFEGVTMLDFGLSGQTLLGMLNDTVKGVPAVIAANPNCVIVTGGINDVRGGQCDLPTLKARLKAVIDALRTALPTTDIVLRMPNRLAYSPNGTVYITPNTQQAAAAYSAMLRSAYLSFENVWPNVVVIDVQKKATGLGDPLFVDSFSNGDELHPADYTKIALALATVAGSQNQFEPLVAQSARSRFYGTEWQHYALSVLDTEYYDLVCQGSFVQQGTGIFQFDAPGILADRIRPGDLVLVGRQQVFMTDAGAGEFQNFINIGGSAPIAITGIAHGTSIGVYRHKYMCDPNIEAYSKQPLVYPYRWSGRVGAAGNGFARLGSWPGEVSAPTRTIQTNDVLIVPGMAPITPVVGEGESQGSLQVGVNVDLSSAQGKIFAIFGNHAYENGDKYRRLHPDLPLLQVN